MGASSFPRFWLAKTVTCQFFGNKPISPYNVFLTVESHNSKVQGHQNGFTYDPLTEFNREGLCKLMSYSYCIHQSWFYNCELPRYELINSAEATVKIWGKLLPYLPRCRPSIHHRGRQRCRRWSTARRGGTGVCLDAATEMSRSSKCLSEPPALAPPWSLRRGRVVGEGD